MRARGVAGAREALARYVVARARVGTGAELYLITLPKHPT